MSGLIGGAGTKSGVLGETFDRSHAPYFVASWNYNNSFWNDQYMSSSSSLTGWTLRHSDNSNNFNAGEGIYSAPIAGKYSFHWHDNVICAQAGHWQFHWYKNNTNTNLHIIYGHADGNDEWQNASGSAVFDLNSGDGIRLRMHGPGTGMKPDGGYYSCWQGRLISR